MQISSALIILTAMDMEVVMMMGNVIVIVTGAVNLTVQVIYQQAHLFIRRNKSRWFCSMYELTEKICFSLSELSPCESDIDCNNKGTCIDGTCSCNNGWEGSSDCSGMRFMIKNSNKIICHTWGHVKVQCPIDVSQVHTMKICLGSGTKSKPISIKKCIWFKAKIDTSLL